VRLLIAAPNNLLRPVHIEVAVKQAGVAASELLLPVKSRGTTDTWLREWAKKAQLTIREYENTEQALKLLERGDGAETAIVAVVSPDHPETLEIVSQAESRRIPVYIYRELYRLDPRVNCRFSHVERPDVWLTALTADQRDFFRRLHSLCHQYGVEMKTSASGDGGSFLEFVDGTRFEGVELNSEACRVRPRGSFRYRKIPLD
jgi:hypothetical protein